MISAWLFPAQSSPLFRPKIPASRDPRQPTRLRTDQAGCTDWLCAVTACSNTNDFLTAGFSYDFRSTIFCIAIPHHSPKLIYPGPLIARPGCVAFHFCRRNREGKLPGETLKPFVVLAPRRRARCYPTATERDTDVLQTSFSTILARESGKRFHQR